MAYEAAVERAAEALKAEGFGVLTTIDVQQTLRAKLNRQFRKYVILGVYNPALADRALHAELEVGLLLPCNVIVYEIGPNQSVVAAMAPLATLGIVGDNLELLAVAAEADERSAPSHDDGPGDAWSPEHLLLAAVQTCFFLTFRAIASASKVEFEALELGATGTVDRQGGITRFTEIILRPRLTVPAGADHDRALRALEKSEKACLVSASLSTPIRLEPEITEG